MLVVFSNASNARARQCYGSGCLGCGRDWEECSNPGCRDQEEVTDYSPWVNESQPRSLAAGQGWMQKRFTFHHTKLASESQVALGEGC